MLISCTSGEAVTPHHRWTRKGRLGDRLTSPRALKGMQIRSLSSDSPLPLLVPPPRLDWPAPYFVGEFAYDCPRFDMLSSKERLKTSGESAIEKPAGVLRRDRSPKPPPDMPRRYAIENQMLL